MAHLLHRDILQLRREPDGLHDDALTDEPHQYTETSMSGLPYECLTIKHVTHGLISVHPVTDTRQRTVVGDGAVRRGGGGDDAEEHGPGHQADLGWKDCGGVRSHAKGMR